MSEEYEHEDELVAAPRRSVAAEVSEKIAAKVDAAKVGLDPIIISAIVPLVTTLLTNLFARCGKKQEQTDPPQTAKEYVAARYDAATDTFDQQMLERMRYSTRRACRKKGQRHLTPAQVDEFSIAALRQTMEEDEQTVKAVCAECYSPEE